MRPIDRIDAEILRHLQNNARMSLKELAATVGLAPSTTHTRLERLSRERILRGAHADVDPVAVGIGIEAMIAIRLTKHARETVEAFRAYALDLSQVLAVYHMAGENDFLVHVAARDARHLRDLAMSSFTTRPEVAHMQTMLIFEHSESHRLPVYLEFEE
jgi:DNA-binding Lrp family transcriptional regulator